MADVQPIRGYRVLNEDELRLINEIKAEGDRVSALVEKVKAIPDADQRWAAEAKTDLQKGFMSLVRSIAKPTSF